MVKQGKAVARQVGKEWEEGRGWAGLLVGGCARAEMSDGDAPAGSYSDLHYSVHTVS